MTTQINLPRDAEGREIPLDTEVLYDKNYSRRVVDFFKFYPDTDRWNIVFKDSYVHFSPNNLSLTKPDSWKKLLEDLDAAGDARHQCVCDYFNRDKDEYGCTSCPVCEDDCNRTAMRDIASRIRNLRSADE